MMSTIERIESIDTSEREKPVEPMHFTATATNKSREKAIKERALEMGLFKDVTGSFRDLHSDWLDLWEKKLNLKSGS